MNNQINLQSLGCKPDKKVPTHGPGTIAYYRGKQCKILSIKNGKAKIFCDGAVLIVNYTSLDDAMYGTMKKLKESKINENLKLTAPLFQPIEIYTLGNVGRNYPMLIRDPEFENIIRWCKDYYFVSEEVGNPRDNNWKKNYEYVDKYLRSKFKKIRSRTLNDGEEVFEIWEGPKKSERLIFANLNSIVGWFLPSYDLTESKQSSKKLKESEMAFGIGSQVIYKNTTCKIISISNGLCKLFADGKVIATDVPMNELKPISELNESNMNEFLSFIFADPLQTSFTMQDLVNKFPELTKHPLTYGMTVLQRKYVGYFVDEEADDFDYAKISTKMDDLISSKFKSILYKYLINNDVINILSNSSKTDAVLVYAPKTTSGYYVFLPPKGVINESELQDKYQKFFKDKLAEYGVNSPAELSKEDKSKFFAEIKKEWPDAKLD